MISDFLAEPDFLDNEKLERIQRLIESNIVSSQTPIGSNSQHRSKLKQTRGVSPKVVQKKVCQVGFVC